MDNYIVLGCAERNNGCKFNCENECPKNKSVYRLDAFLPTEEKIMDYTEEEYFDIFFDGEPDV